VGEVAAGQPRQQHAKEQRQQSEREEGACSTDSGLGEVVLSVRISLLSFMHFYCGFLRDQLVYHGFARISPTNEAQNFRCTLALAQH
jgi:hypothetical protein